MKNTLILVVTFVTLLVSVTACSNVTTEAATSGTAQSDSDVDINTDVQAAEVTSDPVNTEDYLPNVINNNEEELAKYDYIRIFFSSNYGIAIKEDDLYYCYSSIITQSFKDVDNYRFVGIVYYPELDLPYNMTSSEALKLAEEHPDKYHCDTNLSQLAYFYEFKNGVDTDSNIIHCYRYSKEDDLFMIDFNSEYNGFDTGNQVKFSWRLSYLENPTDFYGESISEYKNYIYDDENMTLTYKNEEADLEYHYIYDKLEDEFELDPAESHVEPLELD